MNVCKKISLVMPVYNVEAYLQEAVESVLHQTCPDWELILVDDGSTDSSGAMCDEWATRDERIKVIHTTNGGLSHARNTGLAAASGKWVLFPDSDDRLDKRTLEILLRNADDVDVVICMLEEFPHKKVYQAMKEPVRYESFADTARDFCSLHGMHIFSSACTKMYRRERIRMRFDENVRHMEDILFNLEYLPICRGIRIIPDVLYQYRREQVMTLSKRFWADTLQIRKREVQRFLNLFPHDEKIHRMVLDRYAFYIRRWVCEVMQLKSVGQLEKQMLLELHLSKALAVPELSQIRIKGIDGLMWRVVKSGRMNLILAVYQVYARMLVKKN